MKTTDIKRVFINQPSTLQTFHYLHGEIGVAVPEKKLKNYYTVFFTEGDIHSIVMPGNAFITLSYFPKIYQKGVIK